MGLSMVIKKKKLFFKDYNRKDYIRCMIRKLSSLQAYFRSTSDKLVIMGLHKKGKISSIVRRKKMQALGSGTEILTHSWKQRGTLRQIVTIVRNILKMIL